MNRCTHTCVLLLLSLSLAAACDDRKLRPITPHISRIFQTRVGGGGVGDVDVLFVIDDSNSMEAEQASLRREIPRLVEGLTTPPLDAMGEPRWNSVESLRVAIVTTNMGSAGYPESFRLPAVCQQNAFLGDDGTLRQVPTCGGDAILAWNAGEDADAFSDRVSCVSDVGDEGCGLEQPLAAAGRALEIAAFPRPDALLAVVVLSDEEDCSLGNPDEFFAGSEMGPQLNQRCTRRLDLLRSIEDLAASIGGERPAERFVFAALIGVPEDLETASFETILADPRMQYSYTNSNNLGLEYACTRSEGGTQVAEASPGRRYVQLAQQFEGSLIRSICAESYTSAISELTARIGARVEGICANRSLTPDAEGAVDCRVLETLPEVVSCESLPSRSFLHSLADGRAVCEVAQAVGGVTAGWRYDVTNPTCEQVAFVPADAVAPLGTRVELECLVDVEVPFDPEEGPTG